MARGIGPDFIHPGCKAISTLFPYVVRRERRGNSEMLDAFLDATRVSKRFMWTHIGPYIPILFDEASPRAIVLLSPYVDWRHVEDRGNPVSQWASAVSTVPYTNKFCRSVVDALLHIASDRSMLPRIPVSIWVWLVTLPSRPPECQGRSRGTTRIVVYHVLTLGNIEILKSYLLLVWSEWDHMDTSYGGLDLMRSSIRWCFGGIGMWGHRKDLIKRLDRVLRRLARGLGYLEQYKPSTDEDHIRTAKEQYGELKRELLTVDGEAVDTLARALLRFILFGLLTPANLQNPTRPSCALCLSHVRNFATVASLLRTKRLVSRSPLIIISLHVPYRLQTASILRTYVHRSDSQLAP